MEIFFLDDARQRKPSRQGLREIICAGGLSIPVANIREAEKAINSLCQEKYGFPKGERFKWSPGKEMWMRDNLQGNQRTKFFIDVLEIASNYNSTAIVVAEETGCKPAIKKALPEEDVVALLLERFGRHLLARDANGIVIAERPSGDRSNEEKFIEQCLETIQQGTKFTTPERIALSILTAPPRFVRMLQVADLVVSSTAARISGESNFSPPVFEYVKRMMQRESDRIVGAGLKLHPDFRLCNLYYWLLGEESIGRGARFDKLPMQDRLYFENDGIQKVEDVPF